MPPADAVIRWRLHLASPPQRVYEALSTDAGRATFWAESALESDGAIDFAFPNGMTWRGEVLAREPACQYSVRYFGGSVSTFDLEPDGAGGTDLTLTDQDVPPADILETTAGWVSVLMTLKAAVDHGIDLRVHDSTRTWDAGYCDN